MAIAPQVISEDDGPSGDTAPAPGGALPLGLAGGSVAFDLPSGPSSRGPGAQRDAAPPLPDLRIIEADDNYQPVGDPQPEPSAAAPAADDRADDRGAAAPERPGNRPEPDRRLRRREARDATFARNVALEAELADLRSRVELFEPRLAEIDQARFHAQIGEYDRQITAGQGAVAMANKELADALAAGDGQAAVSALERRDRAMLGAHNAAVLKQQLAQSAQNGHADRGRAAPGRQEQRDAQGHDPSLAQPPSPRVRRYIEDFRARYPWYRPEETRADGTPANTADAFVRELDQQVAEEGYDPASQDYWDELDDRIRQWLPSNLAAGAERAPRQGQSERPAAQRPAAQAPAPAARRGPMVAGAADRAPPSRNGTTTALLTPMRREALILAGALESDGRTVQNKDKFLAYMRKYADFDARPA